MATQPPYPIHESILGKLDPEYIAYYNANLIDKQQAHHQPLDESRISGDLIPGQGSRIPVGDTIDISFARRHVPNAVALKLRCFTPDGPRPSKGWPSVIYLHSGGWVLGNIDTENTICTNLCAKARVMVFSVDYRLAPEHIYPAAVDDCWEAVTWIQKYGASTFSLDISKVVIMGCSAGGNLAATICHRAICTPGAPNFLMQVLVVPVLDNTAMSTNNESYKNCEFSPGLPVEKMLWYRSHYLPERETWPHASPLLFKTGWAELPRTLVVVGELDILRSEGEQYAAKLKAAGVDAELKVVEGVPHAFFAMDGVLQKSRDTLDLLVERVISATHH